MARQLDYPIAQYICFAQIIQHSFSSAVISYIFLFVLASLLPYPFNSFPRLLLPSFWFLYQIFTWVNSKTVHFCQAEALVAAGKFGSFQQDSFPRLKQTFST